MKIVLKNLLLFFSLLLAGNYLPLAAMPPKVQKKRIADSGWPIHWIERTEDKGGITLVEYREAREADDTIFALSTTTHKDLANPEKSWCKENTISGKMTAQGFKPLPLVSFRPQQVCKFYESNFKHLEQQFNNVTNSQ